MSILIALASTTAVVLGARWGFDYRIPGLVLVAVYVGLYWLVARLRNRPDQGKYADEPDPDYSYLPTSGPIGRLGQRGLVAVWTATNLLAILNPFQAIQVFRQIAGNSRLQARARARGDHGTSYENKVEYTLPFTGEWLLYNGGTTPKTSHSWQVLGQRFAMDFVQADAGYRRHSARGTRADEYSCYGAEIIAAADGTVVGVEDRIGDAPLVGWGVCDFLARSFIGNHVLIEHAGGEYGLYAHLIRGSVAGRPGERVRRGQFLGRCGHSGHSSEPHLHFHLQDSADPFNGMGLPVRFHRLTVNGTVVDGVHLTAGNRVAPGTRAPGLAAGASHRSP
jgi:murein DD-endopeptidase MepM/ murein hydrolase activator NlpD